MTVDPQQTNGSTAAGGNTTVTTPNLSVNQDTTDWKALAETWENRYKGASTKINEYDKSVKDWQQKYAAVLADSEGLKASSTNELTDWKNKHQTLEQQTAEQAKKLAQYERKDKIRSLIHSEYKDLATDFEADLIYQAGILSAAETMDEAALKASLTKSSELRKGRASAAVDEALSGGEPPPPAQGGGSGDSTEGQIYDQLRSLNMGDPVYEAKKQSLMVKLQTILNKKP